MKLLTRSGFMIGLAVAGWLCNGAIVPTSPDFSLLSDGERRCPLWAAGDLGQLRWHRPPLDRATGNARGWSGRGRRSGLGRRRTARSRRRLGGGRVQPRCRCQSRRTGEPGRGALSNLPVIVTALIYPPGSHCFTVQEIRSPV